MCHNISPQPTVAATTPTISNNHYCTYAHAATLPTSTRQWQSLHHLLPVLTGTSSPFLLENGRFILMTFSHGIFINVKNILRDWETLQDITLEVLPMIKSKIISTDTFGKQYLLLNPHPESVPFNEEPKVVVRGHEVTVGLCLPYETQAINFEIRPVPINMTDAMEVKNMATFLYNQFMVINIGQVVNVASGHIDAIDSDATVPMASFKVTTMVKRGETIVVPPKIFVEDCPCKVQWHSDCKFCTCCKMNGHSREHCPHAGKEIGWKQAINIYTNWEKLGKLPTSGNEKRNAN